MRKKVLFVINSLNCGGAEKSLVSLLSVFDFDSYDVDLLMFSQEGMFLKLLPDKVNILPQLPYFSYCSKGGFNPRFFAIKMKTSLGLRMHLKYGGLLLHDAQAFWKCANQAFDRQSGQYDAAIAWGQGNPTHYVAEKTVALKKIAFINADYEAVGHNKLYDYPFYSQFDSIVAVSKGLEEKLRGVFPEFSERINTIYDIRNQELIQTMANEFNPYKDIQRKTILVTVGRMVKSKGYELAVGAAKELKQKGVDFIWYFVGDGPEHSTIKEMIVSEKLTSNIVFSGAQSNPYPYIKNADIYIQTSINEGFCLTLCEARGLRVPAVSTDFDVVFNQICDGENGLIVPKRPEEIAHGIERLISDSALYEHIVESLSSEHIGNEEEIKKLYDLI